PEAFLQARQLTFEVADLAAAVLLLQLEDLLEPGAQVRDPCVAYRAVGELPDLLRQPYRLDLPVPLGDEPVEQRTVLPFEVVQVFLHVHGRRLPGYFCRKLHVCASLAREENVPVLKSTPRNDPPFTDRPGEGA